ncbi:MAG: hypothetical protein HUU37_09885 [Bdellovibrionales bacterium]|nr:hypothetical protein [Bdellovibrionales bacterium]
MEKITPELKKSIQASLVKARAHLDYSYQRANGIPLDRSPSEEQLETLESFASRFARFSDLVIMRYLRALALEKDPAFRGSVIDLLNLAEKYHWIGSADSWRRIRELRNVAAHEYEEEDYMKLYQELLRLTPHLLGLSMSL